MAGGLPARAFRPLGLTGLTTAALGFGTYRVDDQTPGHAQSLRIALDAGVNLIDTSTNYTGGLSERCIGQVLSGRDREEMIIVSKVGYVQGPALSLAREKERAGAPFPEMVKYMDGCWHCLHPEFIEDQLGRSLERLGLETVDSYLLHNPEYFFSDAAHRRPGESRDTLHAEFYDRIHRAFAHLEKEVHRGRIRCYGVSSNTFGAPDDEPETTSLERMWTIAGEVAADHHFAVAQLPANFFESGPILERNNGGRTALEFAEAKGIAVLVNRPLNAFFNGGMVRLSDAPEFGSAPVHGLVDPFLPESLRKQSLSRKALAVLMNTRGVTCVLNGMRRPDYVEDAMGALRYPAFDLDPGLYGAFQDAR